MKSATLPIEILINCDAAPYVPEGLEVFVHEERGLFIWNREKQKNALWLSAGQKDDKGIEGSKILTEIEGLAGNPFANANVLDYLYTNVHCIPEELGEQCLIFWGTIYRRLEDGCLGVRCLFKMGGTWYRSIRWLTSVFYSHNPAVLYVRS